MPASSTDTAWQQLHTLAAQWRGRHLRDVFAADPQRFTRYSIQLDGLLADFSKHWLDDATLTALLALAETAELPAWRAKLFAGAPVNHTEQRAALHTALRLPPDAVLQVAGEDRAALVHAARQRAYAFAEAVRKGDWRGYTGKAITDVVNIGIGGSHLGPELAVTALRDNHSADMRVHFIANVDPHAGRAVLQELNPATTLFIVASKTFTSAETLANARVARAWLLQTLRDEQAVAQHFVAVSTNTAAVAAFGIDPDNMFPIWDWVGGRYSLWSAIGLPVMLAYGGEVFDRLLAGAHAVDRHFQEVPPARNIPVLMGLLGVWYLVCHHAETEAVLPYRDSLKLLPAYLQQLCMESLGKSVDRNGQGVATSGSIVWGDVGTNGQHAFFQLLHQGSHLVPVDFILPLDDQTGQPEMHRQLLANCLAQSEALLTGRTENEARAALGKAGLSVADIAAQLPYQVFSGNRPSTTFLLDQLDAYSLGMLLALYEHKVFVQSVVLNINPFDQMGVELGKQLAAKLDHELTAGILEVHDTSTTGLRDYIRAKSAELKS